MIPYGDDVGGPKKAWVTPLLIFVISGIYAAELAGFADADKVDQIFALYPKQFVQAPLHNAYRLITSEFLHADILHVLFNMIYFYAFGRTVEKILGSWIFLLAFPFMGLPGSLFDIFLYPSSDIPRLGASGCISTIMGLYLTLAWWARVHTYFGHFITYAGFKVIRFKVPAWITLVYFILMQLVSVTYSDKGGIAYDIHIACFVCGLALGQGLKYLQTIQDRLDDIHSHPPHLNVF